MSDTLVMGLVAVALVVLAVAIAALVATRRRRQLQGRFGHEYQLAVRHTGGRRQAEKALASRVERHDQLHIRPLEPEDHDRFAAAWDDAQTRFVDDPAGALTEADGLVGDAMAERGYPVGSFDQRASDLSVEHADVLHHYRAAHAITTHSGQGRATTEEQRQAMVHYRALFSALLDDTHEGAGARQGRHA